MAKIEDLKKLLIPEYQVRFDALEKIAFELHKLGEEDLELAVIKRMSGIKMMIDHCNGKK